MVTPGDVESVSNEALDLFSKFGAIVGEVEGGWEGESHDNFITQAENFYVDYSGKLAEQLNSFAEACGAFKTYKEQKEYIEKLEKEMNSFSEDVDTSDYEKKIKEATEAMNEAKAQIESALSTASGITLEASKGSVPSGSAVGADGNSSASTSGGAVSVSDNLRVSSTSGYVFPFSKDVDFSVSSGVGPRWNTNHNGTDIPVPIGTEVHSLSSGTVLHAGTADGYGQWVQIQQDDGKIVTYGHVSKYDFFQEGERVNAGDVVALSGNEGESTGPHLHLQIEDESGNIYDSEELMSDVYNQ